LKALGAIKLRWYKVEALPHHLNTAPPNPGNPAYSNSILFGPQHGRWLGRDLLESTEILVSKEPSLEVKGAWPKHPQAQNGGLGTIRFRLELELKGKLLSTRKAQTVRKGGIHPGVFRISFRTGDDLAGWLSSYFNIPNLFGSAGQGRAHQTELHQGTDCADVIVGAARKMGAKLPYSSVSGLIPKSKVQSKLLYLGEDQMVRLWTQEGAGAPQHLLWGKDLQRGDLVLIKYAQEDYTGRVWDHIGVLSSDQGQAGELDAKDLLLHMGYLYGLVEEEMGEQIPFIFQIRRFRRHILPRKKKVPAP